MTTGTTFRRRPSMPSHRRRRLPRIVAVAALICASVSAIAAPTSVAGAASPPTNRVDAATHWLTQQFGSGGLLPGWTPGSTDMGTTLQAIIGLGALDRDPATTTAAWNAIVADIETAVAPYGTDDAGRLALAIQAAVILGHDPTAVGSVDLVARLTATQQTSGLFGATDPTYDGVFRQGLALNALGAVGQTNASGTAWLVDQQCADGSFMAYRSDTTTPCPAADPTNFTGPDTNSTAMAAIGLSVNDSLAVAASVTWLTDAESTGGGWSYFAGSAADANSTALVLAALQTAQGSVDITSIWQFQARCDAPTTDIGGFAFQADGDGTLYPGTFATSQALWALSQTGLPFTAQASPVASAAPICDEDLDGVVDASDGAPSNPCFPNTTGPCATVGSGFTPLSPARIYDSRTTGGAVGPGVTREVVVAGRGGVPATATAVAVTVTAIKPTSGTYVTVFPAGQSRPASSTINLAKDQTRANLVVVGLGSGGAIDVFNRFGSTGIAVDVTGFFSMRDAAAPTDGFVPITPTRALDTRVGIGGPSTPLGPSGVSSFSAVGGDVPVGADAVAVNITSIGPTASSYLSAYPTGGSRPGVSAVNFTTGEVSAAMAIVPLSNDGHMSIYNYRGSTDVAVDVVGYFDTGVGDFFRPIKPARILNSRSGLGTSASPWGAAERRVVTIPSAPIDASATAFVGNLTAVQPTATTYVTAWPNAVTSRPNASSVNAVAGDTRANAVIVGLGPTPDVSLYNRAGSTHLVLDLTGWFGPSS